LLCGPEINLKMIKISSLLLIIIIIIIIKEKKFLQLKLIN
jgi:hypothetical protein